MPTYSARLQFFRPSGLDRPAFAEVQEPSAGLKLVVLLQATSDEDVRIGDPHQKTVQERLILASKQLKDANHP
jgi:hypothetical protein